MKIQPLFFKNKLFLIGLIIGLSPITGFAQTPLTITTIAGDGQRGYNNDEQLATIAQLNYPHDLAIDQQGTLYIADSKNHRIRKIDNGIISTIAGNGIAGYYGDGGPAVMAQLNEPSGLALDHHGQIYIADSKNHVIRKIDRQGTITTIAGNNIPGYRGDGGPALKAQLNLPMSLEIDPFGNLYVIDQNNHVIRKINTHGIVSSLSHNLQ